MGKCTFKTFQHLGCPFCSLDFTVYARMEELAQDGAYFFHAARLDHLIEVNMLITGDGQRAMAGGSKGGREMDFWKGIEKGLLDRLGSEGAYKTDLDMFGYSINQYIDKFTN